MKKPQPITTVILHVPYSLVAKIENEHGDAIIGSKVKENNTVDIEVAAFDKSDYEALCELKEKMLVVKCRKFSWF